MAFSDYKYTALILILGFVYFQFFHHAHHQEHSKFQVTSESIVFHSNWTKSLDDVCCLGKLHSALNNEGVQNLDISLSMSSFSEEDLRKILPLNKFRSYKNIRLDLSGLNITNSGIEYVLNLIQPNVKNLQLNLNGLQTKSGFGNLLAQKLNNLKSLKELQISLIMSIKPTEVDQFVANHKPSSQLKSLDLILIGNEITKEGLSNLEQYLSILSLNSLHLNFYANKLGAEGAEIVSKALSKQSNLQNLQLDLYFNNITEVGTQNITSILQTMSNLKSLELNLDFNYIKNQGGKAVGKMLQKMTNLESLHLGVASKNFGYLGFKYVISGLQKLTQLKKLILRCGINRVGYNGAEITKEMLSKMENLQHLELGFIENYVGDDGIGLLAEQVASMKKLKRVYLNLGFNDAKSFGLIKAIRTFVKNNYESLHLSLSSNQFRDNDVKLIENDLSTLISRNEEFIFDFTDTAISKNQVKRLQKVFVDSNKKHDKNARISINSIIPDEQKATTEKTDNNQQKQQSFQNKTSKQEAAKKQPSKQQVKNKTNESEL